MKKKKYIATIITLVVLILISCTSVDSGYPIEDTCLSNNTKQANDEGETHSLELSRKLTERQFSNATGGYLLSYPLVFESDPSLFWLLVCDDSTKMLIDRVYLVDATHEFRFDRDIFSLDSVYYKPNEEGPFSAVVSRKNGTRKSYIIDGFMYNTIIEINKNEHEYPSNIAIPVKKISK